LARLRIGQLGASLDRLAAYCNAVQTNTGAMVRMTVAAKLFFPIPIDRGLDANGPVTVFTVIPPVAGDPLEKAMILPVSNGAALKESLSLSYEVTEQDGRLKLAVPQGFDKPERQYFVRIDGKRALVATSEEILGLIARIGAGKGPSKAVKRLPPDGEFAINVRALRRQYRKKVEAVLMMALVLLPSAGGEGHTILQGLMDKSRELEHADLKGEFKGTELSVVARMKAQPDTPTAMLWSKAAAPMRGGLLARLPEDTCVYLQTPLQNLVWTDLQLLAGLRRMQGPATAELAQVFKACRKAVRSLAGAFHGEVAMGMRRLPDAGLQWYCALESPEGDKGSEVLKGFLEAFERVTASSYATIRGLQPGEPLPWRLKALPGAKQSGRVVWGYELVPNGPKAFPEESRKSVERVLGWPVVVRCVVFKNGLVMVAGKASEVAVKEIIRREKKKEDRGLAGRADVADAARKLPAGTDVWTLVRPLSTLRLLLDSLADPRRVDLPRLFGHLQDGPLQACLETGGQRAVVRIRLPASSVSGLVKLYFRMVLQGVDPRSLLERAPRAGPKRGPAPPPPLPPKP
jgi:hypothetical protein